MRKYLAVGLAIVAGCGLGYGIYRVILKTSVKSDNVMKDTSDTVTDIVSEPESVTNEEVDMSTNRAQYYAITKDVKAVDLDAMAEAVTSFLDLLEAVKNGSHYEGKFYVQKFNVVGFITATDHGNVVVWNDLNTDDDTFDFWAPNSLLSILPKFPGGNFKSFLNVGKALAHLKALDEAEET